LHKRGAALPNREEFQEIAHSGGQIIIRVETNNRGNRIYQLRLQHSRPVPSAIFAFYALPQGIVVGQMKLGGIGSTSNPPPFPDCFQVFISSDTTEKFGHQCPICKKYWRGEGWVALCPYCGIRAELHRFLTTAQRKYVKQYCIRMEEILNSESDGECIIDMDAVADAVGKSDKPPFYYAEESQQNKFICSACGSFNDILGRFGYCSVCGTRNDLQELSTVTIPRLRDRINTQKACEDCVRDAVSVFDTFVDQIVVQLLQRVPMTQKRKKRFDRRRYHNLQSVATDLKETFDIDILDGLNPSEIEFAALMFHRRHVYEHKGGEVDEKYIADSGDTSVRPKQALHETIQSANRIVGIILHMAQNLHNKFHEIIPPEEKPIRSYQLRQKGRIATSQ
jgi:hypothetical protein